MTEDNYQMLGFLDAMKDLKNIPDVEISQAIIFFKNKIGQLSKQQVQDMIRYAVAYPPRVRALLGAILETMNKTHKLEMLRLTLNPLTRYELGISEADLKTATNWNIQ